MMRFLITIVMILLPSLMMGQASGGQIIRKNGKRFVKKESSISNSNSPKEVINKLINNMVYVEGGTFLMGASSEPGNDASYWNEPIHEVTISSFYICRYEVTQEEWTSIMNTSNNPSSFKGMKKPVENISWAQCQSFINMLNYVSGKHFRLPTEAEWEYAARGGSKTKGFRYSGSNILNEVGWNKGNSSSSTHVVGKLKPNELGLYDMSGNVYEWCSDWFKKYKSNKQYNPTGPQNGTKRVSRGGCWFSPETSCRVYTHDGGKLDASPLKGFRLACDNL